MLPAVRLATVVGAFTLAAFAAATGHAGDVVPLGNAFVVNEVTAADQFDPSVAIDGQGGSCVAFAFQDSGLPAGQDREGVRARCFDDSESFRGDEVSLNAHRTGAQIFPQALVSDDGLAMCAVWESIGQDGDGFGIYYNCFELDGGAWTPTVGGDTRVNTQTEGDQLEIAAAILPPAGAGTAHELIVAYSTRLPDDPQSLDVVVSSVDAPTLSGAAMQAGDVTATQALVADSRVNQDRSGDQLTPDVCADGAGNFVVTWTSDGQDGDGAGVFGRRYQRDGTPRGNEFQVNTYTSGEQDYSQVCCMPDGRFVVVWDSGPDSQDYWGYGVFAQRYDSVGAPVGTEFQVSSTAAHSQYGPRIGCDDVGRFVVSWTTPSPSLARGLHARTFDSDGVAQTNNFKVRGSASYFRETHSLAMGDDGSFVVVWTEDDGDGDGFAAMARRYQVIEATTSTTTTTVAIATTTSTSTTTTTVATTAACGDAVMVVGAMAADGRARSVTASDGLAILQAAVGIGSCALCVCDVDGSGSVAASDALVALAHATGQSVTLACPPCN